MRLTCPNCDAQYEVDEAVIPDEGRDVQCSSCGHTWFQLSAARLAEAKPTEAPAAVADDGFDDLPDLDDLPPAAAMPAELSLAAAAPPEVPAGLKQRTLDDAVLNVLREEAERESSARQAEGSSIEAQSEFGLGDATPVAAPPPAAETTPIPPAAAAEPDPSGGHLVSRNSRRELLPDIEEINSTLRASSERSDDPAARDVPETLRQRRSGFRRGFLSALTVMILALLPYVLADSLATRVPALATAVTGYSHVIDSVRLWLDGRMKSTTDSLRSTATSP